jgi:hypothetical protein
MIRTIQTMMQRMFANWTGPDWPAYLIGVVIFLCIDYILRKHKKAKRIYNCIMVICFVVWYWTLTVPPDCSAQSTTDLVKRLLMEKRGYPEGIRIGDIRTEQGGLFARRFECKASIKEDPAAAYPFHFVVEPDVRYSSEMTDDAHTQFVTIFADPFALSEHHTGASDSVRPQLPTVPVPEAVQVQNFGSGIINSRPEPAPTPGSEPIPGKSEQMRGLGLPTQSKEN